MCGECQEMRNKVFVSYFPYIAIWVYIKFIVPEQIYSVHFL